MADKYVLRGREVVPANSTMDWALMFEDENSRRVAKDIVGDVAVSTVFLGLDHQFGDGPPLLFESMVFGGPMNQEQRRYTTWEEAERGHAKLLAEVRAKAKP